MLQSGLAYSFPLPRLCKCIQLLVLRKDNPNVIYLLSTIDQHRLQADVSGVYQPAAKMVVTMTA